MLDHAGPAALGVAGLFFWPRSPQQPDHHLCQCKHWNGHPHRDGTDEARERCEPANSTPERTEIATKPLPRCLQNEQHDCESYNRYRRSRTTSQLKQRGKRHKENQAYPSQGNPPTKDGRIRIPARPNHPSQAGIQSPRSDADDRNRNDAGTREQERMPSKHPHSLAMVAPGLERNYGGKGEHRTDAGQNTYESQSGPEPQFRFSRHPIPAPSDAAALGASRQRWSSHVVAARGAMQCRWRSPPARAAAFTANRLHASKSYARLSQPGSRGPNEPKLMRREARVIANSRAAGPSLQPVGSSPVPHWRSSW